MPYSHKISILEESTRLLPAFGQLYMMAIDAAKNHSLIDPENRGMKRDTSCSGRLGKPSGHQKERREIEEEGLKFLTGND